MSVQPADRLAVSTEAMARRLGEETVILDLASGTYFGLDEVGSRVWELIEAGRTVGEICDDIQASFDASPDEVRTDVTSLVSSLLERGLVAIA